MLMLLGEPSLSISHLKRVQTHRNAPGYHVNIQMIGTSHPVWRLVRAVSKRLHTLLGFAAGAFVSMSGSTGILNEVLLRSAA